MSEKDLSKVLHYYGLLEDSPQFKIICPFHEDVNPSLSIDLSDGRWWCFGCNEGGDAVKFVKKLHPELDDLGIISKFQKILKSKKVAGLKHSYQKKKKVSNKQAIIEAKDYYYCLSAVNWLKEECEERNYMLDRGFTAKTLNQCEAKLTYNSRYPIVFAMRDMGKFRGWVCRTTDLEVEKKRKYLYNTGFSRRNTLVGKYDNKVVLIVEGYMDYLKAKQFGITYVVAILGWKITDEQVSKLKAQGVETIISALDNDKKGHEGTRYLRKYFNVVKFRYGTCKDLGEMNEKQFKIANAKTKKAYRRSKIR